jgi:hypothetical protein
MARTIHECRAATARELEPLRSITSFRAGDVDFRFSLDTGRIAASRRTVETGHKRSFGSLSLSALTERNSHTQITCMYSAGAGEQPSELLSRKFNSAAHPVRGKHQINLASELVRNEIAHEI